MSIQPTKTTNRLHFSDLDSTRFEDICFMLLNAMYDWLELIHIGRTGTDGGVDIKGTRETPSGKEIWMVQCKRYAKVSNSDLKLMVDKITHNHYIPHTILLIISCDITNAKYNYINAYCKLKNIPELIIWTATSLETYLHANPKIKNIAFESDIPSKETIANIQKINSGLKMKEKLLKAIINHKVFNDPAVRGRLSKDPSLKFISEKVYIRSVNDTTYPDMPKKESAKISPWFRTFFYDIYHNGLEFWLSAGIGADIIMDKDGFWEPIRNSSDKRIINPKYKILRVKTIARIPYSGITAFIPDGDEMTSCPHLFCLFDKDEMPYEEIYYKYEGNKANGFIDSDVDRNKQTLFPMEDINENG